MSNISGQLFGNADKDPRVEGVQDEAFPLVFQVVESITLPPLFGFSDLAESLEASLLLVMVQHGVASVL